MALSRRHPRETGMTDIDRRQFLVGAGAIAAGGTILSVTAPAWGQGAEIQIGIPADTSNNLPTMIASALGFFKDEGLNVKVVNPGGGANARQMVVAGQLPYSMGDVAHPLFITGAGKKAKVLMGIDTRATLANVMVRQELWDKGIRTVDQLANYKKPDGSKPAIGVTRIGSATWLYGSFIFNAAGLGDKVNFVSVGDGTPMLGAFRTGRIDAVMANMVTYFSVLDEKMGKPVYDASDKAAWDKFFGGSIPSQCLFAMEDQIKAQPAMTQAVVNATYRALKHIEKTSPKELFAAIEGKFLTAFAAAVAEREITYMKPIFDYDGSITEEIYKHGSKIWFNESTKIAPQPYAEMVDLSFLKNAHKKYG
jgi:NitT/TauT family transport system substrate-binding protein